MHKEVYEIDDDGFIIERYLIGPDDDLPEGNIIPIDLPQPNFWRPKWTGNEWVEDKTQAEFDEEEFLQSLIPDTDEIANAELELKILNILNILMEVELI